jgi:hypothetical protein
VKQTVSRSAGSVLALQSLDDSGQVKLDFFGFGFGKG